jgi:hypothetical protein
MTGEANQPDDGSAAMQIVVSALRALMPPPGAGERWVRQNALSIDEIARRAGFGRPALALALLSAGVGQTRDRNRAISVTNLSRALAGGRKEAEARRVGIDGAKVEALVVKAVTKLFPTITTDLARVTVEETVARLGPVLEAARPTTPSAVEAVQPPAAVTPAPSSASSETPNAFADYAARKVAEPPPKPPPSNGLEGLLDMPLEKLITPAKTGKEPSK